MSRLTTRQKTRRALLLSLLLLFPITFNYYSPALPIMGAAERVACFSLLFWLAWTVVSLLLGRSACGYFCPLGGLQEVWDVAVERRLVRVRFLPALRYVVFALWVGNQTSHAKPPSRKGTDLVEVCRTWRLCAR